MLSLLLTSLGHASTFMPPQASTIAPAVDRLYAFLLIISVLASILVIAGMLYFIFKYRRKSETEKSAYITHNHLAEFLWSFIPLVLFIVAFVWGWKVYHDLRFAPENAYEIFVRGQQWSWEFEYQNGHKSPAELYVPVGRPVKLLMTSSDVIHSFFIPSFRVKQDVLPGRYSSIWFEVKEPGEYQIFCTEYCGLQHSSMLAKVVAVPQKDFDMWVSGKAVSNLSPEEQGHKTYIARNCNSCHSIDGSAVVGPTFKGNFGLTRQFEDGGSAVVDENYLRESILDSQKHIVKGYTKVMPTYEGVLEDKEVEALIAFIKSLKN